MSLSHVRHTRDTLKRMARVWSRSANLALPAAAGSRQAQRTTSAKLVGATPRFYTEDGRLLARTTDDGGVSYTGTSCTLKDALTLDDTRDWALAQVFAGLDETHVTAIVQYGRALAARAA